MKTYNPIPGTSEGAPHWGERRGWGLTNIEVLPADMVDEADVGVMFRAEFIQDGVKIDLFADEIVRETDYKHTHVSTEDGSPAMLIHTGQFVLMNEDGYTWRDDPKYWEEI